MKTIILTSPHVRGPRVEHLQNLLQQKLWFGGEIDGDYGPLTAQAVYRAKFWLGYVKPDQVAGDLLVAYLDGSRDTTPKMKALAKKRKDADDAQVTPRQKFVKMALSQLGVTESPAGTNQTKYGAWYGANGVAWCAIFDTWCGGTSGFGKESFKRGARWAYVPYILADAGAGRYGLMLATQPLTGNLATFDWDKDGTPDHVGICVSEADLKKLAPKALAAAKAAYGPLGPDDFWSVEGNTAVGNDSNGGEVMLRKRNRTYVACFIKIAA